MNPLLNGSPHGYEVFLTAFIHSLIDSNIALEKTRIDANIALEKTKFENAIKIAVFSDVNRRMRDIGNVIINYNYEVAELISSGILS